LLTGDVVLENVKLKREALKRLNFPIEVYRGTLLASILPPAGPDLMYPLVTRLFGDLEAENSLEEA